RWCLWCLCVVFFFQAEDGIRDWSVTGVQTCALPIWRAPQDDRAARVGDGAEVFAGDADDRVVVAVAVEVAGGQRLAEAVTGLGRSEERRVGKEWRARWWRYD